jgi:hypothetical protein
MSESRRFLVRKLQQDEQHSKHSWHTHYAWLPVRLTHNEQWVWGQTIYRRALHKTYATYDDHQRYEYADLLGILKLPLTPGYQR